LPKFADSRKASVKRWNERLTDITSSAGNFLFVRIVEVRSA
jgi:hypothetical protein